MIDTIHWLGHDSFRLDGSRTVYIDPWKLSVALPPADLILVTHDHYDHFSPSDIAKLATAETTLIGPPAVTAQVGGITSVTLAPGETVTVGEVTVSAVAAYNIDKFRQPGEVFHPRAAAYLGFVVELDGQRVYHAGDTDAIPEMREVRCDVALLPVSGTYVMTADEAVAACESLAAAMVVPMHYGDIVGSAADAARLQQLCKIPVTVLPLERG